MIPIKFPVGRPLRFTILIACSWMTPNTGTPAPAENIIERFAQSDFVFQRINTNVPLPPLFYMAVNDYRELHLDTDNNQTSQYSHTSLSQAAALPLLVSPRDALVVGEWAAKHRFTAQDDSGHSFSVTSLGLPLGWVRQINYDWQLASFVFPTAYKANLPDSDWSEEWMGGVFGRYVQHDTLWWGFGFFIDINPGTNLYLPYLGFSWTYTEEWTISAVMPWPAILYSPSKNTSFRLGMSPSGTSWFIDQKESEIYYEWDGWNFGLTMMQRLQGNFWLEVEAGVSGLRSLSFTGGEWQGTDIKGNDTPYIGLQLSWRPDETL